MRPLQTELLLNNHTALLDIHRNTLQRQEDTDSGYRSVGTDFLSTGENKLTIP